jgi:hypothetical protein
MNFIENRDIDLSLHALRGSARTSEYGTRSSAVNPLRLSGNYMHHLLYQSITLQFVFNNFV